MNLEVILSSGEDSAQWEAHVTGSPHTHSPQAHPWVCLFSECTVALHAIHILKIRCSLSGVCKSHACCCTVINSAVSANGIITFLINLSNLLHLCFFVRHQFSEVLYLFMFHSLGNKSMKNDSRWCRSQCPGKMPGEVQCPTACRI